MKKLPSVKAFIKKEKARYEKSKKECAGMGFQVVESNRPYITFLMELMAAKREDDVRELMEFLKKENEIKAKRAFEYEMCKHRLCYHNHGEE